MSNLVILCIKADTKNVLIGEIKKAVRTGMDDRNCWHEFELEASELEAGRALCLTSPPNAVYCIWGRLEGGKQ